LLVVFLQATLGLGSPSGQAQATAAAQLCLAKRLAARRFQRLATLCLGQRSQLTMAGMRWKAEAAKGDCDVHVSVGTQ
jgi:hypothetical protein